MGGGYIPPVTSEFKFYFEGTIDKLDKTMKPSFYLNHYYTKSKNEFAFRISKTDAVYKKNNKTMKNLYDLDKKCIDKDFTIQFYLSDLEKRLRNQNDTSSF